MTQYYVSKTSTNGYVVGSDSNDGLTKATPWLTVNKVMTTAANGDSATINDGTYTGTELGVGGSSGFTQMTSKLINLAAENSLQVTFKSTSSIAVLQVVTPPAGGSLTLNGIIFDGNSNTANYGIWLPATGGALYTVGVTNCQIKDVNFYGFTLTGTTAIALTVTNTTLTGVGSRRFMDAPTLDPTSSIVISGGSCTITDHANASPCGINLKAALAGATATISNFTLYATISGILTGNGQHGGVFVTNMANVTIRNCNLTVIGYVGTRTSLLINVTSDLAVSSAKPQITGNTVRNGTTGGYGIVVGADGTSAGDNQSNSSLVFNNTVIADVNNPATPVHGILIGWCTGGTVYGNYVYQCGIGIISKDQTTGARIFSNVIVGCGAMFLRSKGSVGTVFAHNTCVLTVNGNGPIMQADDDGATHSTGIVYWNNLIDLNGVTPSGFLVTVAALNTATFGNNQYSGTIPATSFSYQGTTYATLALWNAGVPTQADVNVDAGFVARGAFPDYYKLRAGSGAIATGKGYYPSGGLAEFRDFRGYKRLVPSCRGAYETQSGE